jgi:hypothetical protein
VGVPGVAGELQQLVGEPVGALGVQAADRVRQAGWVTVGIVAEDQLDLLLRSVLGAHEPERVQVRAHVRVLAHRPTASQLRVEACNERSSERAGIGITVAVCWWARMLARSPSANRP